MAFRQKSEVSHLYKNNQLKRAAIFADDTCAITSATRVQRQNRLHQYPRKDYMLELNKQELEFYLVNSASAFIDGSGIRKDFLQISIFVVC